MQVGVYRWRERKISTYQHFDPKQSEHLTPNVLLSFYSWPPHHPPSLPSSDKSSPVPTDHPVSLLLINPLSQPRVMCSLVCHTNELNSTSHDSSVMARIPGVRNILFAGILFIDFGNLYQFEFWFDSFCLNFSWSCSVCKSNILCFRSHRPCLISK